MLMYEHQDVLDQLNKDLPLREKLRYVHGVVQERFEFIDRLAVAVYDPKTDLLKTFVDSSGEDQPLNHYQARLADAPALREVLEKGRPRVVNDLGIGPQGFGGRVFALGVHINSIGDKNCWGKYREELKLYYRDKVSRLCKNCKKRFKDNPLRLLDCKEEECAALKESAPNSVDYLDKECHDHFKLVLEFLDELNIPYVLDPYLVRGLDYYARTVFEIVSEEGGEARTTMAGGGRYDYLVAQLGGKPMPAVGGSIGIERVVNEMRRQDVKVSAAKPKVRVFLAQLGDLAKKKSLKLFEEFRKNNIYVSESFGRDSIKAQLRVADRMAADLALIIGQKEALDDTVILREMQSGVQEIIPSEKIINEVKKRLKKIHPRQLSNNQEI